MALEFENKFLSAKGQKERLSNVGKTLVSSITGKGVLQETKKGQRDDTVLSKLASNPFGTALAIATLKNPKVALQAVKTAPKTTIGVSLGAPIVASAVASNPKGSLKTAEKATGIPKDVSNYVGNVVSIKSFDDVLTTAKENPVLTGLTVAGAGLAIKGGVSAISTAINTGAIRENTQATRNAVKDVIAGNPLPIGNPVSSSGPQLVSGEQIDARKSLTSTSGGSATLSAPPAVNIQQNNYFGEKYLNKLNYST